MVFLWQPLAVGESRVKASWENVYVYGMFASFGLAVVGAWARPDTSCARLLRSHLLFWVVLTFLFPPFFPPLATRASTWARIQAEKNLAH